MKKRVHPPSPPRWADRFLVWYCSGYFLEEIQGDLYEQFEYDCEARGVRYARLAFIIQVFRFFRPFRIKSLQEIPHPFIHPIMFRNYFKITWRNLMRHKVYSLLNILGLAIGMAACLLILRFVSFEMSYDAFHETQDRLFRLNTQGFQNGELQGTNIHTGYAFGPLMQAEVPEVEAFSRAHPWYGGGMVSYHDANDKTLQFFEDDGLFVDTAFLKMFSYPLIEGDINTTLSEIKQVVLTESAALRYFGSTREAMGKTLKIDTWRGGDYIVSAVLADLPDNTHLKFDFLMPMEDLLLNEQYKRDESGWGWQNFYTYIQLHPGADTAAVMSKMQVPYEKANAERLAGRGVTHKVGLQPIASIHLTQGIDGEPTPTGNQETIYFFVLIAVFILLIAWVNYMNLSTARAIERAREVGIRKTVGASRGQLIRQFLFESLTVNALAVLASAGLMMLLLPVLGEIIGKDLSLTYQDNTRFWTALAVLFTGGAFLSGLYPAFVLSSFRPVAVLKGAADRLVRGVSLRRALVVFQFAVSVALMAGAFAVYQQITHMMDHDLGMKLDQLMIIKGPRTWDDNRDFNQTMQTFKTELMRSPNIERVASANAIPGGGYNWGTQVRRTGTEPTDATSGFIAWVDFDFLETYEIEVIAGRPFSKDYGMDESSLMINETAVTTYGFESVDEALQGQLIMGSDTSRIIAVLKDFGWNSLQEDAVPFMLAPTESGGRHICVKVGTADLSGTIATIEEQYKALYPGNPFDYYFQDEFFNRQYQEDQKFGSIFGLFTTLAILVACLGLFGLSAFTVGRRIREIGIRKVLGASVSSLLVLLSRDFLILVIIANVIGLPLAWLGISKWLEGYSFRISPNFWMFFLPALLVLGIAILTVSYRTFRAARANPSDAIRYE